MWKLFEILDAYFQMKELEHYVDTAYYSAPSERSRESCGRMMSEYDEIMECLEQELKALLYDKKYEICRLRLQMESHFE